MTGSIRGNKDVTAETSENNVDEPAPTVLHSIFIPFLIKNFNDFF
jgi:hypothetical protein